MKERDIFFEAIEIAVDAEREGFLRGACGNDIALRQKVDELLKEHFAQDSLLAKAAIKGHQPWIQGVLILRGREPALGATKYCSRLGREAWGRFIWRSRPNR